MNKEESVKAVLKVREYHIEMLSNIRRLVNGRDVEVLAPVAKTKCTLGKWLYNPDNRLKDILGLMFYEKIDALHEKWHAEYINIYNIFDKKEKKSFLSKIMGSNKIKMMDIDKAKAYYADLEITTEKILTELDKSHRRFLALSDASFEFPST